jgi:hypothetical protein
MVIVNKPLIGFLPPDIGGKKIADDTGAMTITINVVQTELMPQWGDSDGVEKLIISFMLFKLLEGKV